MEGWDGGCLGNHGESTDLESTAAVPEKTAEIVQSPVKKEPTAQEQAMAKVINKARALFFVNEKIDMRRRTHNL